MKLTSTWAEHCPAYYVALNMESKAVLIAVRGTAQIEDVVTDLTALPVVRAYIGHMASRTLSLRCSTVHARNCEPIVACQAHHVRTVVPPLRPTYSGLPHTFCAGCLHAAPCVMYPCVICGRSLATVGTLCTAASSALPTGLPTGWRASLWYVVVTAPSMVIKPASLRSQLAATAEPAVWMYRGCLRQASA